MGDAASATQPDPATQVCKWEPSSEAQAWAANGWVILFIFSVLVHVLPWPRPSPPARLFSFLLVGAVARGAPWRRMAAKWVAAKLPITLQVSRGAEDVPLPSSPPILCSDQHLLLMIAGPMPWHDYSTNHQSFCRSPVEVEVGDVRLPSTPRGDLPDYE